MAMKAEVRKPAPRVQVLSPPGLGQRLGIAGAAVDPVILLDLKRADTASCVSSVQDIAQQLGADRSITEQNQQHQPVRLGFSLAAEQRLSDPLAAALDACPTLARRAGLTGDALRGECAATKEAQLLGERCWGLATAAKDAGLLLGHGLLAVLDLSREGLATRVNQGGAPAVVAAAQADYQRIDAPLSAEAQRRSDKGQGTQRQQEGHDESVQAASERAQFDAILAQVRAGRGDEVPPDQVLWAEGYFAAHRGSIAGASAALAAEVAAPVVPAARPASNRRGKQR